MGINVEERRMIIPFKIYIPEIMKAKVADPNPPLSNIEAKVKVLKKTKGVNSKNTKPATILLLKLC